MALIGASDLVRIIDYQDRGGQQIINRYYYLTSDHPTNYAAEEVSLVSQIETNIISPLAALQHSSLIHVSVGVQFLTTDRVEYVEASGVGAGATSGTALATNMAVSAKLLRSSTATRNGWKRYGGLREEDVEADVLNATVLSNWVGWADVLAENRITTSGATYTPVIVRDRLLGVPIEDVTEWLYSEVATVQFLNRVTTQNTRKRF